MESIVTENRQLQADVQIQFRRIAETQALLDEDGVVPAVPARGPSR